MTAIGGSGRFEYEWKKENNSTNINSTSSVSNLDAGNYVVKVFDADARSCYVEIPFQIINKVNADINAISICEGVEGDLRVSKFSIDYSTLVGGYLNPQKYEFIWNFGAGIKSQVYIPATDVWEVEYRTGGDKTIILTVLDEKKFETQLFFDHYVGKCFENCGSSQNFQINDKSFSLEISRVIL